MDEDEDEEVVKICPSSTKQLLGKKRKIEKVNKREELLQKAVSVLDDQVKEKEDEHDAFGKYVASQLRTMDPETGQYVHFKIQELIFQVRCQRMNRHMPYQSMRDLPEQASSSQLLTEFFNVPQSFKK